MAGNIKGITIEFNGDTTKLDRALRQVKQSTKDIDSELRAVNKALKLDPKNTDLLRQKQELLGQKIKQTEANLKELKSMQEQVANDPSQGKNSAAYRELQREIVKAEGDLKKFNAEQAKIKAALSPLGQFSAKMKDVGTALETAGQKMKAFSAAGAAVVAGLGAMTYKAASAADEFNTLSKVTGIGTSDLQMYALAAEQVDVSVETIAKANTKLKKTMSSASSGTGDAAEAFRTLGVEVTNSDGTLRDSNEVFNEVIAALGGIENETERDAMAMTLMGKSASELNPLIEDGGETYERVAKLFAKYDLEIVDQETLDKANQFNDAIDDIKSMGTLALQTVGASLAEYLLPVMEKVVDVVGRIANWLSELDPRVLSIVAAIAGAVAVISPLLIGLGKLSMAISAISNVLALAGVSFGGIVAAIGPVILIIGALVAAGVLLYKNWDTIKATAIKVWTSIKTTITGVVTGIRTAIQTFVNRVKAIWNGLTSLVSTVRTVFTNAKNTALAPLNALVERVKAIIAKIKGFFNFTTGTPKVKLPHFSITPAGWKLKDLLEGIKPTLGISWYAKGGIFDRPTIAGIGEAGAEAVVPLDKLWKQMEKMQGGGDSIVINVYGGDNVSAKELAAEVERRLIAAQKRRTMAWQ